MEGMNNMFTYRLLENRNPKNGHLMSMSPSVKMSDCFQKYYVPSFSLELYNKDYLYKKNIYVILLKGLKSFIIAEIDKEIKRVCKEE